MSKFSESFIYSVFDFARAVQKEFDEDITSQRMTQILDAFDPDIAGVMLLEMISGNTGHLRIRRSRTEGKSPINAIKAVRTVSRLGLRESKHIVDTATEGVISTIPGNYDSEQRRNFVEMLTGTGYEVVCTNSAKTQKQTPQTLLQRMGYSAWLDSGKIWRQRSLAH